MLITICIYRQSPYKISSCMLLSRINTTYIHYHNDILWRYSVTECSESNWTGNEGVSVCVLFIANCKTLVDVYGYGWHSHVLHSSWFGLWNGHLTQSHKMLPFLVAAGHRNYVADLPHYLEDIRNLAAGAPWVHTAFLNGHFIVHETQGRFNGIWSDMALGVIYNE